MSVIIPTNIIKEIDNCGEFNVSGATEATLSMFNPLYHEARVVLFNPETQSWKLFKFHTVESKDGNYRIVSKYTNGKWHGFAVVCDGRDAGQVKVFSRFANTEKLPKYAKLMNNLAKRRNKLGVMVEIRCPKTGRNITSPDSIGAGYGPKAQRYNQAA